MCTFGQAAIAAHQDYVWAVDPTCDSEAKALEQMLEVVNGCLDPDPSTRWVLGTVLQSLNGLHHSSGHAVAPVASPAPTREVGDAARAGGGVGPKMKASPPPELYDVITVLDAMEALSIDSTAVVTSFGGKSVMSVEDLRKAMVEDYRSFRRVKSVLPSDAIATEATTEVPSTVIFR